MGGGGRMFNNPFGSTNCIRFAGYDLSPQRAPLCFYRGKGSNNARHAKRIPLKKRKTFPACPCSKPDLPVRQIRFARPTNPVYPCNFFISKLRMCIFRLKIYILRLRIHILNLRMNFLGGRFGFSMPSSGSFHTGESKFPCVRAGPCGGAARPVRASGVFGDWDKKSPFP